MTHTSTLHRLQRRIQILVVLALTIVAASRTGAQQVCTPPTAEGRGVLWGFLHDEGQRPWVEQLGIVGASSDTLHALSDPADSATCRRIQAAAIPASTPLYMFWAGGNVIVTTVPPLDTFPTHDKVPQSAWVFDSLGMRLHSAIWDEVVAPLDLRVASSGNGRVVLQWSNPVCFGLLDSYQLLRASGSGPFVPIGFPIPGSATTATDSTASPNAAYRYRLVGRIPRDSNYSNSVGVTVSADVSNITRPTTGLLFRDDFNRPDEQLVGAAKNWDRVAVSGGTDADLNIVGNIAKYTGSADNMPEAKHTPESGPILVQADWKRVSGGRTGIALFEATTGAQSVFALRDPYHGWELWYHAGTSWSNVLNNGGSLSDLTRLTLLRLNNRIRMWAGSTLIFDWGTNAMNGVGLRGGMYMIQPTDWDNFIVCKGSVVSISGLPNGYRLRIAGVVSPTSAGGTPVTVDLAGKTFPVAQLEILDQANAVARVYTPSDGVWGGDQYAVGAP